MKPKKMRYSYKEFSDHFDAQDLVQQYRHITTPGAGPIDLTNRKENPTIKAMRVMEYMRDLYDDDYEASLKCTCFVSIMRFVSHHVSELERAGLAYTEDGELVLKEAAYKAVHHLYAQLFFERLHENPPQPTIEEVIALASDYHD